MRVNEAIVIGASGELSDFQYLQQLLEELTTEDFCMDDGHRLSPRECFAYLSRVLYNRRNKYASELDLVSCYCHKPSMCSAEDDIACFPFSCFNIWPALAYV